MPIMTVTAAIAGLKNTFDLAKAAVAARDEMKLAEMQQSINDRIIDVQNAALALQEKQSSARDEIDELKDQLRTANEKIAKMDQKRAVRDQYVLEQLTDGVFVLASIEPDTSPPGHYICQPCMDNDNRLAVLQRTSKYGGIKLKCPLCSTEYRTGEQVPMPQIQFRNIW
ncbi:hypothetical protein [Burkholderia gladioli]|uniref:hypothetical protein n=1 Tax=Burkholderia gladioli TaxID=28095 RepID=UPI001641C81F|nr:hypothetical protein [Burkholderia gladioli]MBJ9673347.1 hypothetical protein [Burkholderia gladioli]MDN7460195.1 hypothetical protein [Burkholderia gladioli]